MKSQKQTWYRRIFDAIIPATRAKIQHSERHILKALAEQNQFLKTELEKQNPPPHSYHKF